MNLILLGIDLVAICVLVFAMFVPRHGRRDMVVSFLVVNIAVFSVAAALSISTVAAGVGLGLFGVLSIIRLRSEELSQYEVAYYFAALAIGLLTGLSALDTATSGALVALILVALFIGDHPALARPTARTELVLDHAYAHPEHARTAAERLLGGTIDHITVNKVDLVDDTTHVSVRYTPVSMPAPAQEMIGA